MSLVPRWFSRLSGPNRFSPLFEDLEKELFNTMPSGLSVSSDDKNFYVEAHVPGLTAKEVEVTIDNDNVLWIKGEKKEESRDKQKKFYPKDARKLSPSGLR